MASFTALKTAIQNVIKQNGNEEITGDVLQQILLSIVNTMGDGAINTIEQNLSSETLARKGADNTLQSNIDAEALARGNADTQLQNAINAIKANIDNGYVYAGIATPSSTPVSGKVFYVATAAGTYTNFGGQVLTQGINILRYNGSAWSHQQLIGIDDVPTAGSNNFVKSGGVQNELALGAVYDVSAKNPTAGPNSDGKWESLSALLSDANLNTLIPTAYRKGGMSIKFVQSSDNNYVQYRLMADSWSINTDEWSFCGDSVYVENPEWIYILLDSQKRILAGLKSDGSVEWSIGVPTPVKTYIDNAIAEIKNGTEGTDLDGLNKIITFFSEFSTSDTLKDLLDTKVDKEEGKSLVDATFADSVHYVEDKNNIYIVIDSQGRIVGGRRKNGIGYENIGFKISDCLFLGKKDENNIRVLVDKELRILSRRDTTGKLYENVGIQIKDIDVYDALRSVPFYSTSRFIQISDSHYAEDSRVENGVDADQRMDLMVGMIETQKKIAGIDFVISTGDSVMAGYVHGVRSNYLPQFKTLVVDKLGVPFFPVVGNHDAFNDEEWYNAFGVKKQYSVSINDIFLIVLDVYRGSVDWAIDPSTGTMILGSEAIERGLTTSRDFRFTTVDNEFLEQQLIIAKKLRKTPIVAMHTVDYASAVDTAAAQNSVNQFYQLMKKYDCKLRLFGHSHIIQNEYSEAKGYYQCNPGWFGRINAYNYNTSPWAINLFSNINGEFSATNIILAHDYVDTPRLGNVPASETTLKLWKETLRRGTYNY